MKHRRMVSIASVFAVGLLAPLGTSVAVSAGSPPAAPAPGAPAPAALAPGAPDSSSRVVARGDVPGRLRLTNLAHLNFLLDRVPLTAVPGHTTYKLASNPVVLAPWTYADKKSDGSYQRVGGGAYDPATNTYSQGAYNADDIARTAVVYLKHWQLTGNVASQKRAFQTLRSLTFLQTDSGPYAGNVVLWQQANGALTPSAVPIELPDPSDSAESFWLARTVWALGEGYAAFKKTKPEFAAFLRQRMHLALASLNRQSLSKYGTYNVATGVKVPAWLIVGGADASAEAVLGLTSYTKASPKDKLVKQALSRLTKGIAMMSAGSINKWPYGAILPSTYSQGVWHAWAGMTPAALAGASMVLPGATLRNAAVKDAARFTPQLLTAGGPDNDWAPTPSGSQIAYGVDSRVQGLVATAKAANAPGLMNVAAIAAGWFFGANRSGQPAYDRATGACIDGIEPDGRVNQNSGAESTIQALLTMLTLDANPKVAAMTVGINKTVSSDGLKVVKAGPVPVNLIAGGTVTIPVAASNRERKVYAVVNRSQAPAGITTWSAGATQLGVTANGGAGTQGIAPTSGIVFPFWLSRTLPAAATEVVGQTNGPVSVHSLLIQPLISSVTVTGPAGDSTLLVSAVKTTTTRRVTVPKGFKLVQQAFDSNGKPVAVRAKANAQGKVTIAAGGFTVFKVVHK